MCVSPVRCGSLCTTVELLLHLLRKLLLVQFKLFLLRDLVFDYVAGCGICHSLLVYDEIICSLLEPKTRGTDLSTIFERHLLHGHLHTHCLFKLHLLQHLQLGCILARPSNKLLRSNNLTIGLVIILITAELTILSVAHHHQVALELLLLR